MSSVRVKENEPFDVALRRFKRLIEKTGLLNDLRAILAYWLMVLMSVMMRLKYY